MHALLSLLGNLKGLLIPLLPFLFVKAIGYIQRARINYRNKIITPVSATNWIIISILIISALLQIFVYIPYAVPKINVFLVTGSRMQTPGEVIGRRLRDLYGDDFETAPNSMVLDYDLLISRLASTNGRALYSVYGTDAYASCQWCRTDEPLTFFLYNLPGNLLPYAVNFLPVMLVTMGNHQALSLSSPHSRQWFSYAALTVSALVAYEIYTLYTAPVSPLLLSTATTGLIANVYWMHWATIKTRGLVLAALNTVLAFVIYLSASGRAFDSGETTTIRSLRIVNQLDTAINKLRLAVLLHTNVIARNEELRDAYCQWGADAREIADLTQHLPEIIEARKQAKARVKPSMRQLEIDATVFVDKIFDS